MGQVSRKSDPNSPNVEFICILTNYIKPRKHLNQREGGVLRKIERLSTCNLFLKLNLRTNTYPFQDFL